MTLAKRITRKFALGVAVLGLGSPVLAAEKPTIEGVWQIAHPQTRLLPLDGKPLPFTAEGRKQFEDNRASAAKGDYSYDSTLSHCTSPGQPRLALTDKPFALFVRPRMVTLLYQWNRLARQIAMGTPVDSPALGEKWWKSGQMQGHAEATWEGDTLVVHTGYFADLRLLDALVPATDKLKLTERIRLLNPNLLEDRITVEDSDVFTHPWTSVVTYKRLPNDTLPFAEDVCIDRLKSGQPVVARVGK